MKTIIEFFGPPVMRLCLLIAAGMVWIAGYNLIQWREVEGTTWAAWIQAFGSIAAIIVAVVVMNMQHSRDRNLRAAHALEREIIFAMSVEKFATRLSKALRGFETLVKKERLSKLAIAYQSSAFAALCRMSESFPSWETSEIVATHLLDLQQTCHIVSGIIDSLAVDPQDDLLDLGENLTAWAKQVDESGKAINMHRALRHLKLTRTR